VFVCVFTASGRAPVAASAAGPLPVLLPGEVGAGWVDGTPGVAGTTGAADATGAGTADGAGAGVGATVAGSGTAGAAGAGSVGVVGFPALPPVSGEQESTPSRSVTIVCPSGHPAAIAGCAARSGPQARAAAARVTARWRRRKGMEVPSIGRGGTG
jgi:hypothetical protein